MVFEIMPVQIKVQGKTAERGEAENISFQSEFQGVEEEEERSNGIKLIRRTVTVRGRAKTHGMPAGEKGLRYKRKR